MPYFKEKIEGDLKEAFKYMAQEKLHGTGKIVSFESKLLLMALLAQGGQLLIWNL